MIAEFFSAASRKAWVGGALAALVAPIIQLLNDNDMTTTTWVGAIVSGVVAALGVYLTENQGKTPPVDG